MSEIGHNSAPFGQELRADLEILLNENSDTLFIYAQWHIGDYLRGTQGMTLEHEGAYQRFLMRLYARGKPLPDDDTIMASMMALSTRVWKRVKEALIHLGKIIVRGGCLTNARFEKERLKRAEQLRKRSNAAQQRWQQERENSAEKEQDGKRVSAKFEPSLPETSAKLPQNEVEKPNEINDAQGKSAYANQYPITKSTTTLSAQELLSMRDRMEEAAGPALASQATHLALMYTMDLQRWLKAGCDFEQDILPAIRKGAHRRSQRSIKSWRFFEDIVTEFRDRRLAPVAEPVARAPERPRSRMEAWQQETDEVTKFINELSK